ncbi:MAG TPA: YdeI/OmpD-associated family protein [Chthoniobacterales bacterium]|nr:YdeI/OmpD-associated family protein [Chthoniobacterales bacterium]
MATKDPRVDAYIKRAAPFARPILKHLRKIAHVGCPDVEETIKWQSPFFERKGIICFMAAFKEHCVFGFWKGSLIFGEKHKGAMGHFGRITSMHDLPDEKKLIGYVRKAAELNEAGVKKSRPRSRTKQKINVPSDLKAALQRNAKARKTFEDFSYSHKKEYVDWITDAKRDETRKRRLQTAVQWLIQGKPQNWKYL